MSNELNAKMNVVVAMDGSGAEVAVRGVTERRWPSGTQFRVLTVVRPYLPVSSGFAADVTPPETYAAETSALTEHARQWSERAADTLKRAGLSAEPLVRYGDPRRARSPMTPRPPARRRIIAARRHPTRIFFRGGGSPMTPGAGSPGSRRG